MQANNRFVFVLTFGPLGNMQKVILIRSTHNLRLETSVDWYTRWRHGTSSISYFFSPICDVLHTLLWLQSSLVSCTWARAATMRSVVEIYALPLSCFCIFCPNMDTNIFQVEEKHLGGWQNPKISPALVDDILNYIIVTCLTQMAENLAHQEYDKFFVTRTPSKPFKICRDTNSRWVCLFQSYR